MKKRSTLLFCLLTLLALCLCACACAEAETTLTILGTSDLHGNIWGYTYEDSKETRNDGMARLYTYIQQVRRECPNVILIDNGDTIQGTIMTDDLYNKAPERLHPVLAAMNAMGYDAMALGNHEFNWGIPTLKQICSQAQFPVLCANVLDENGQYLTGAGWTIVERSGIRVAIIGVVYPAIPIWDMGKPGIDQCTYERSNDAVQRTIAEIGDEADLIVVAAHMGLWGDSTNWYGPDSGQKILYANPQVQVLLVGHEHNRLNKEWDTAVIGAPRNAGRDIVRFDLTFDADRNLIDSSVTVVDMKDIEPSEALRTLPEVAFAHNETIQYIQTSVLGSTTAAFQPESEIFGLPSGRLMDTPVMDLINHIQLINSGADVSAAPMLSNNADLPQGDIHYGDIFEMYKYDNTLCRVTVTGAELKAYMEWSAEYYNQWVPGDINISFDPDVPNHQYDMFAGVEYEIDLSQPKGHRIRNVLFHGQPLQDDQLLTLAVSNYRYSTTLKGHDMIAGVAEWESSCSIRDMIVAYFAAHSPVAPMVDNNWRIVGVDLQLDDPRRAEIIEKIRTGEIPVPDRQSYNLNDQP